jgi:hypothetical protein
MAQHSPWGWVMAGIPATALLLAISMIERRAGHNPAAITVTAAPVAEPSWPAIAGATNGHNLSGPATRRSGARQRGRATPRGGAQARMRAHWDAQVAEGRIPTGAALNRAAGKDPNYSLGKRARATHTALGADAPVTGAARAGRQGSVDELHLITGGARRLIPQDDTVPARN